MWIGKKQRDARSNALQLPSRPAEMVSGWRAGSEHAVSKHTLLFADAACQGPGFHRALAKVLPHLETEIVKRSDQAKGFVVLPTGGWSGAQSPGSIVAAGSPRIGKISIERGRVLAPRFNSRHAPKTLQSPFDVFRTESHHSSKSAKVVQVTLLRSSFGSN